MIHRWNSQTETVPTMYGSCTGRTVLLGRGAGFLWLSNISFTIEFPCAVSGRGKLGPGRQYELAGTCTIRHWNRLAVTIPTRYGTGTERTGFLVSGACFLWPV